jgi:GTP-binding protein EngB required for normal cell division
MSVTGDPVDGYVEDLDPEQVETARVEVRRLLEEEARRPLVVSVMGQTGVGKSSLVNALFGTDLRTGAVKPTTKEPEDVITEHEGHQLVFRDLPGLGEGLHEDAAYIELYRETLEASDIVIWALHADSRTVTTDRHALELLLEGQPPERERELFSKLTFVLTKADLATAEPWILGLMPKRRAKFAALSGEEGDVLDQKCEYFREVLVQPFGHLMHATTYNDVGFDLQLPSFHATEHEVVHDGYLSLNTVRGLAAEYPQYEDLFTRLWQNFEIVAVSARYRFNLTKLMLLVLNRLGPMAVGRFEHFLDVESLDWVSLDEAKRFRNFVVVDPKKRRVVYDLASAL